MQIGCLVMTGITRRSAAFIFDGHDERPYQLSDILFRADNIHAVTSSVAVATTCRSSQQPGQIKQDAVFSEVDGCEVLSFPQARLEICDTPSIRAATWFIEGSDVLAFQIGAVNSVSKISRLRLVPAWVRYQIEMLYARSQQDGMAGMTYATFRLSAGSAMASSNQAGKHTSLEHAYFETTGQFLKLHKRITALLKPNRLSGFAWVPMLHFIAQVTILEHILLGFSKRDTNANKIVKTRATLGLTTLRVL
ncbi:hypothetical protein GCM10007907_37510 [Chitinimonas prasina]|uniref:Uncharacterized protein n=1 Tax=Chitinimonas prasina TaxID=1434937 RepID=A0ABQ5YIZ8_9NEIS|nr:hypothetical protein [Chitinimonas prasina]GLR14961.1 hypothetical protein GCM10007907_37510 [Chitinimonas prasina]